MSKFKVGDMVKLAPGRKQLDMTAGKHYEVVHIGSFGVPRIMDDIGVANHPLNDQLILVNDVSNPVHTCICHKNSYKDPATEHFYFCKNYVKNETASDNHTRR